MKLIQVIKISIVLLIFWLSSKALAQNLNITSFQPSSQSMTSVDNLVITVSFDSAIDPASVDNLSFTVFGRWSGACPGTFSFRNNNQQIHFAPDKNFSVGEWITVTLSKNIQRPSGENLSTGFSWNFWTSVERGSFDFERIALLNVRKNNEGMIRTYGAYAGDLNGDGFHDFTVPNEDVSDVRVFMNDGSGGYSDFTTYSLAANSTPSTNEGADFNGDGFLDFVCGNISGNSVSVLFGDGTGMLKPPATYPVGSGTRGLCVLDLNSDGAQDIVTANRASSNISILLNNGDGTFAQSINMNTAASGETACAAADANEDGITDVFVGSFNSGEIIVLLGDGNGSLNEFSKTDAKGSVWMIAVGDMDNDGHVDVVSANSEQNQFALLRGDGNGNLSQAEVYDVGAFPLAIDVGDIDGDGDLDVVTSNFFSANWTIYENDGNGNFVNPRTLPASSAGSCAILHDRDRDGDLDMTGIDELDDLLFIFDNTATTSVDSEDFPSPKDFQVQQSYPNPFFKSARVQGAQINQITIPFSLNRTAEVKIELFNIKGQRIASLVDSEFQAGHHSATFSPKTLAAGVYFYRLSSRGIVLTKKIAVFP